MKKSASRDCVATTGEMINADEFAAHFCVLILLVAHWRNVAYALGGLDYCKIVIYELRGMFAGCHALISIPFMMP